MAGHYADGKASATNASTHGRLFEVDEVAKLEDASELGSVQQAIVDGATRTQRVAVVLLDFEGSLPQVFTPDDARARMSEVRAYYQEITMPRLSP